MSAALQILDDPPVLRAVDLVKRFGFFPAVDQVNLDLYPGEVLGIVGESGSGKTTLLKMLSGQILPTDGNVYYRETDTDEVNINQLSEADRRRLRREAWGFVHQNPRDGLRPVISAGGNIVEPLLNRGDRHYDTMRREAESWMKLVELDVRRIDHPPKTFSGGMQQRVQIARSLVHGPDIVFMDEPTGGLDVSVQAKLLDTLRHLVRTLRLSVVIVTHDLGVARLLADRLIVMRNGRVVETGITDQVLDDPQDSYTQLLVSAVLT